MSFSEEQFIGKLNGLDETQESIVGASKWLLTLYKEAHVVAQSWSKYILMTTTNTRRKLLAIYLVNDVIQQAKHKRILQFGNEFGKVLPEVFSQVFPDLPQELQKKVKRVVHIWRQRQILSENVLAKIEDHIKKGKPTSTGSSNNADSKIEDITSLYQSLGKYTPSIKSTRLKFEKSLDALDPKSMVYPENFKTVTKIATSAKEILHKSIDMRRTLLKHLETLGEEQKKVLNSELDSISEIDLLLSLKDPSNVQTSSAVNDDVLPTYEQEIDSENSSEESDDDSKSKKRSSEDESDPQLKRVKVFASDDVMNSGYEPTAMLNTDAAAITPDEQNSITSSIQDLLSKLAN
ncbi:Rtt103p Ecym_3177 [Eremothecium cymbalariae DBVPG|uniref:CID domain-containing protein n=1 Tax=Eremothecium cymbalariae (strain CBS 270.75 / DBVPG 7215 / KCTC 17166 / NRRL Y-17582) TaxID=931890 RepID=G8JRA8_ERECY|nr:Hypothetical protein Ecym_3177 [Eremothecium cymbalariae DBVPG\